jgi:hypothetical protein
MTPQQNKFEKSCSCFPDGWCSFELWIPIDVPEELRGFEEIIFGFNGKGKLGKIAGLVAS